MTLRILRATGAAVAVTLLVASVAAGARGPGAAGPAPGLLNAGDKAFLANAAHGACFNVATSTFALAHWKSSHTRQLATRIRADHLKALAQLQAIGRQAGIPLTATWTPRHARTVDRLQVAATRGTAAADPAGSVRSTANALPATSLAGRCARSLPPLTRDGAANDAPSGSTPFAFDRLYANVQAAEQARRAAAFRLYTRGGHNPLLVQFAKNQLRLLYHQEKVARTTAAKLVRSA